MNSAILTKKVRLKPDTTSGIPSGIPSGVTSGITSRVSGVTNGARASGAPLAEPDVRSVRLQGDQGLQPWQFFVLAGLGCATAITFLVRGQGVTIVLLVGVLIATTVLVGLAALRTLRPLVSADDDRVAMIGQRTRAALEREKHLTLRAIKELEFDRAMGKLAEADFVEMSGRLRVRAARLIRQLDAGAGYREQIERDIAARLAGRSAKASRSGETAGVEREASLEREGSREREGSLEREALAERLCTSCSTVNDPDARFCKACGQPLSTAT